MKIETKFNPDEEVLIAAKVVCVKPRISTSESIVEYAMEINGTRLNVPEELVFKKEKHGKYDNQTEE